MTRTRPAATAPRTEDRQQRDVADLVCYGAGLVVVVAACYGAITLVLAPWSVSAADLGLARMWSIVAGVFVFHLAATDTHRQALVRISATLASVAVCLLYLAFWPTTWWGLSLAVAVSAVLPLTYGRRSDAVTAAITTTVILQVAARTADTPAVIPLLRLLDTAVGTAVGMAVAGLVVALRRLERPR